MKSMMLFSSDKKVARFLEKTFKKIIGHVADLYSSSLEEGDSTLVQTDIVLVSGEFLRPKARALFPKSRIISPDRVLVGQNLEKLLMLPKGEDVLVVNSPRKTSEETIDSLNKLGMNHLNYIPFWKGCDLDFNNIKVAVSPGMMHLCPDAIRQTIDIGPRIVSILSFLQILTALELDIKYLETYSDFYHRMLMASSRKLAVSLERAERLSKYEEIIINEFDDGLIYVDEENRVSLANKSAAKLLKAGKETLITQKIEKVIQDFELLAVILKASDQTKKSAHIYDINGEKTVVTKIPVVVDNRITHIYTLRRIDTIKELEKKVRVKLVKKGHVSKYSFSSIWTKNQHMKQVIEQARDFASTGKNILITAESGMGKELFAHAIHQASPLRTGPFVAVNFAGIVDGLIESELFGYEEGAFTGAKKGGKKGLFEQAQGGTIFLDEIGDASLNVQSSLLRVLQEKEVLRVGGSSIIPVEVRIIAATNKDIYKAIKEKKFRNDLFYRLNTFPIHVPPLREHREDIIYIMHKYLKTRYGIVKELSSQARNLLLSHDWPGNIRELINIAEYVFYSSKGSPELFLEHFPDAIQNTHKTLGKKLDHSLENDFEQIRRELEANGLNRRMMQCLVSIILEKQGKLCGRNSLIRELGYHQYQISEGKMKKSLNLLKKHQIILVGKTKQGTVITRKGRSYLTYFEALNPSE